MKKSLKLFMALLLISSFALSFSSCKDSENVTDDPNSPENIALSKETESARALLSILSFTSQLDSLPDNWASNSFTVEPTIGIVNDASTPYVRYVPVLNKEEAITKYNSFAAEGINKNANSASWNIENVGSMKFNVLDQADVTAILDINIKQQPHLTQIRFVPASALGSNGLFNSIKNEPYYSFGDIVSLKEGQNTSYWVCVRPCSQLDQKGKSHWLSFQLNDWDDNKKNNVDSKSLNFYNYTKTGYKPYYLPTQLGDPAGAREHLQNLFRLLMVLNSPTKYQLFSEKGLGSNNPAELTQNMINDISEYWDSDEYWNIILPEKVTSADISNLFNSENPKVNVFYKGYTKSPSVFMAKLTGKTLDIEGSLKEDEIKWERTQAGVDFHDYATYGVKREGNNITELPNRGFIVRYKTGAQLVGSWGNDQDYEHSFEQKHKDIIKDVYVYRKNTNTLDEGASVIGDIIDNYNKNYQEVCVLNHSKNSPKDWGQGSYYFRICNKNEGRERVLQNKSISTSAHIHLLNALILNWRFYENFCQHVNHKFDFSSDYEYGLKALYQGLAKDNWIYLITNFRVLDKDGYEVKSTNDFSEVEYFAIDMHYKDETISSTYGYRQVTLQYNIKTGKYSFTNEESHNNPPTGSMLLSLKSYTDIDHLKPLLDDAENQSFQKNIYTERRHSVKSATIDYIKKILSQLGF